MKPTETVVSILTAIIGVAIVAVILSKNSATVQVIQSAGTAFGQILSVAVSPITGGGTTSTGSSNILSSVLGNGGGSSGVDSLLSGLGSGGGIGGILQGGSGVDPGGGLLGGLLGNGTGGFAGSSLLNFAS